MMGVKRLFLSQMCFSHYYWQHLRFESAAEFDCIRQTPNFLLPNISISWIHEFKLSIMSSAPRRQEEGRQQTSSQHQRLIFITPPYVYSPAV